MMVLLVFFLACLFVAAATGVMAGISDFKTMTIPNIYSVIIMGAFLLAYAVLWLAGRDDVFFSPLSHLISALVVFLLTAGLFAMGSIGAADSKLATVYALWTGIKGMPVFLFYMALAGGVLGLASLALARWKPVKNPMPGSWIAKAQSGESKVPYGMAIAAGALASFVKLGYIGGDVLSSFLLS